MHKLSKTDRFSYRLRLHKFERIRFLLFTRDMYGYLIVSDLWQVKQSFSNLLIIYEEIFNQYLEIGENYSQILQTLILTFSQNMDEFEKQVQTLENVHHLMSKYRQGCASYFQPACLYLEIRGWTLGFTWECLYPVKVSIISSRQSGTGCLDDKNCPASAAIPVERTRIPLCRCHSRFGPPSVISSAKTFFPYERNMINMKDYIHGEMFCSGKRPVPPPI